MQEPDTKPVLSAQCSVRSADATVRSRQEPFPSRDFLTQAVTHLQTLWLEANGYQPNHRAVLARNAPANAQAPFVGREEAAVCVALLALWLMRVNARKHVREDYSRLMRRHQEINKHLPPRGDTLLESLVMIVFCAVVAAAIVVCLSDEEDLGECSVRSADAPVRWTRSGLKPELPTGKERHE